MLCCRTWKSYDQNLILCNLAWVCSSVLSEVVLMIAAPQLVLVMQNNAKKISNLGCNVQKQML